MLAETFVKIISLIPQNFCLVMYYLGNMEKVIFQALGNQYHLNFEVEESFDLTLKFQICNNDIASMQQKLLL